MVISEGGSVATLVAQVNDVDWNLEQVIVDLSPIGGLTVEMNDRGIDGDVAIGDDKYTTGLVVPGLEVETYQLEMRAVDSFGVEVVLMSNISVVNQAPRLTYAEISPFEGPRGTNMVVNLRAYDGHGVANISLDLRDYGGDLIALSNNSELGQQ